LRLTDDQRRPLVARAKALERKVLADLATIVTPETVLCWHQRLIAHKYDGSHKRGPGRPRAAAEIEKVVSEWRKRTEAEDTAAFSQSGAHALSQHNR